MRKVLSILLATIAFCILLIAAAEVWLGRAMLREGEHTNVVRVHVGPGASLRSVLENIESVGALRDARKVEWYLRTHGENIIVKAGNYDLAPGASPRDIVNQLAAGRVVLEQLTVVEGWRFSDLRKAVAGHVRIKQTLAGATDADIMAALGHPKEHPEGRFFPDTYRFADGTTDLELLRLAYSTMAEALEEAWSRRVPNLPLRSSQEALILASIVEKETALGTERARIAGVFIERLRRGMRLQTDPTVIYGIGPTYDGNIRRRDLITDTPYNTYTRSGLPPTPIALPGRDSLIAAVQPREQSELYFVATGAGDGSHYFSRTLAEHNAAVARLLARQKKRRP